MDEELLKVIKKIIKDKGTHPQVATFTEIRHEFKKIENKAMLNESFRGLVADKKIRVRRGINDRLVEIL